MKYLYGVVDLDRDTVKQWVNPRNPKNKLATKPPEFAAALNDVTARLNAWITGATLESAAGWLLFTDRWLRKPAGSRDLERGQIVSVELGVNFEGEMSYCHRCLVLKAVSNWAIVVPMTSQRFGNGILVTNTIADAPTNPAKEYRYQVDFVQDGSNESALVEQVRMINKQRVISVFVVRDKFGNKVLDANRKEIPIVVSDLVLKAIDRVLVKLLAPSVTEVLTSQDEETARLRGEVEGLKATVLAAGEELQERDRQIQALMRQQGPSAGQVSS